MNSGKLPLGHVRPLRDSDIEGIAALHARVTGRERGRSGASVEEHFRRIFLDHPWRDDELPSLVYESDGKLTGCIGVMPRPMRWRGQAIRAAVSHTFLVDRDRRHSMAGVQLARRFFQGPQELSLAEGNDLTRRLWTGLKGSMSRLYSLSWTRPLRPARYLLSMLERRGLPAVVRLPLRPLCGLADAAGRQLMPAHFRPPPVIGESVPLDVEQWRHCWEEMAARFELHATMDAGAMEWQLSCLERRPDLRLHRRFVRDEAGKAIGWYLYYAGGDGTGSLIQLGASPGQTGKVVDHLFADAHEQGLCAISGSLEAQFFDALSERDCLFHHVGDRWMLVHSPQPGIRQDIHEGGAFLSRLDAEWWINHIYDW